MKRGRWSKDRMQGTLVRGEVAKLDRVSGVGESRRSLPRSTHADHHRTSTSQPHKHVQ